MQKLTMIIIAATPPAWLRAERALTQSDFVFIFDAFHVMSKIMTQIFAGNGSIQFLLASQYTTLALLEFPEASIRTPRC